MADELLRSRKSVNDLVRAELNALMARPELSAADRARLEQHFQAIRDAEVTMGDMADAWRARRRPRRRRGSTRCKSGLRLQDRTA